MHCLIVGPRGVGKSTLIRRVLAELACPVAGFVTVKEPAPADDPLGCPVHLYPAQGDRTPRAENRICYCGRRDLDAAARVFDAFAPCLEQPAAPGGVLLMDELGFLESRAEAFCGAVLRCLDGEVPVIAAVKDRPTPFLDRVRTHPGCRCFFITPENRDRLFEEVLLFMKEQVRSSAHAPQNTDH